MPSRPGPVNTCLIGLALALVIVGLVSGTIVRHLLQIAPIVLLLATLSGRPATSAAAALPVFAFWLAIAVLIWMFLLGVSRIANGHYTRVEIAMTIVRAACSMYGSVVSLRQSVAMSMSARVGWFVVFALLQVTAMWMSMSRTVATR